MDFSRLSNHISQWLLDYSEKSKFTGFVVGISGGIDSAVTSTLCAQTGKKTILVNLPIKQSKSEYNRASEHIENLKLRFANVENIEVNLTETFELLSQSFPLEASSNTLAMANTRSRLRMTTLYAIAQSNNCLVAGTGNKIEDFGIGFYTKYGDGGVDISPIADLLKSEVFQLGKELNVIESIQNAAPTDGLWGDKRTDEDQIGASYPELEWAMLFDGNENDLTNRKKEVLAIYRRFNSANQHKMIPIPVCIIPEDIRN
ncbi:MAG: NAD(+) synthase [Bacteroidota bacterium]